MFDQIIQQKIIEKYMKAYNEFDIINMLSDMHEDVIFENITGGEVTLSTRGIEALKEQAEQTKAYFTQREQKITSIKLDGDSAEVGIAYNAILAIDLPNGLKAGDKLELQGKSIFKFKNNKIIQIKDLS